MKNFHLTFRKIFDIIYIMNKKIRDIAERIILLETSMQNDEGKSDLEILYEIENISSTLSFEEMLQVDDYIQKKIF